MPEVWWKWRQLGDGIPFLHFSPLLWHCSFQNWINLTNERGRQPRRQSRRGGKYQKGDKFSANVTDWSVVSSWTEKRGNRVRKGARKKHKFNCKAPGLWRRRKTGVRWGQARLFLQMQFGKWDKNPVAGRYLVHPDSRESSEFEGCFKTLAKFISWKDL